MYITKKQHAAITTQGMQTPMMILPALFRPELSILTIMKVEFVLLLGGF
jgi:hypothetical protein